MLAIKFPIIFSFVINNLECYGQKVNFKKTVCRAFFVGTIFKAKLCEDQVLILPGSRINQQKVVCTNQALIQLKKSVFILRHFKFPII